MIQGVLYDGIGRPIPEGNDGTTDAVFTVTLSAASTQTVSVTASTTAATATSGVDYVATTSAVEFPPGTTSRTLAGVDFTPVSGTGPYGGPALVGGQARSFTVHGHCGVPATARAVALNLTVIRPAGAGHLTLYPSDVVPPNASALNYAAGRTRANDAVIGLSAGGALSLRVAQPSGSVHAILDLTGYFE